MRCPGSCGGYFHIQCIILSPIKKCAECDARLRLDYSEKKREVKAVEKAQEEDMREEVKGRGDD